MREDEIIYTLALTRLQRVGLVSAHHLLDCMGSATEVFLNTERLKREVPRISPDIVRQIKTDHQLIDDCRREYEFIEKHHIECILRNDSSYPVLLRECVDAPVALFYRGTANLNAQRIVSIVGTRHGTDYGERTCQRLLQELKELCPEVLVVSGLAYGIDIFAHRAALQNGFPTVGVLAHGLDRIYPFAHRQTAAQMVEQGGLLTEFPSKTNPDRQNFVQRNRIVAGMAHCTIVVESAAKGGALITANLAFDYGRDCFAVPGRTDDVYSAGCNQLIADNKALLIRSGEDVVKAMRWDVENKTPKAVQRELFVDLNDDEQSIVQLLGQHPEGMQLNVMAMESGRAVHQLTSLLFALEMKGVIRLSAGNVYQLV